MLQSETLNNLIKLAETTHYSAPLVDKDLYNKIKSNTETNHKPHEVEVAAK